MEFLDNRDGRRPGEYGTSLRRMKDGNYGFDTWMLDGYGLHHETMELLYICCPVLFLTVCCITRFPKSVFHDS